MDTNSYVKVSKIMIQNFDTVLAIQLQIQIQNQVEITFLTGRQTKRWNKEDDEETERATNKRDI